MLQNLKQTSKSPNFDAANELLKLIKQRCNQGHTLLHEAVFNLAPKECKIILELTRLMSKADQAKDFINKKDKAGYTALHYAVDPIPLGNNNEEHAKAQRSILELLLSHPDTNIAATDNDGRTVLHWAVANNNLEAVALLLENAKIRLTPEAYKKFVQMKTYIHKETHEGDCAAIYFTLSSEEDEPSARERSLAIFNLLLEESDINGTDHQGHTIAHWAAVEGRNDILKVLIAHQVDLSLQDKKGRTVLHATIQAISAALKQGKKTFVSYLTDKEDSILNLLLRLPPFMINWHQKDQNGNSALALASHLKLPEQIIQRLEDKEKENELPPKKRKKYL